MRLPEGPSRRWVFAWIKEHRAAGGWCGPATVEALLPLAARLYGAGATPGAAGIATARDFELSSALGTFRELAMAEARP